jgi:acyl carrier protein
MTNFIEAEISAQVAALCKWITEGSVTQVDMGMSLTRDLGFDSMKIMQFFAGIEDFYPGIALEDWFIENSASGRDTIGSVVGYVGRVLTPMAAE